MLDKESKQSLIKNCLKLFLLIAIPGAIPAIIIYELIRMKLYKK